MNQGKMLLFQVHALLTIFILVSCEKRMTPTGENDKQLTKRQIVQTSYSNPIFNRVFQSNNPEDSLVTKFLGDENHPTYTIAENEDYIIKIYLSEQPDDENYANGNREEKGDKSKNMSKDVQNSYFQGFYWPPQNENDTKVNEADDPSEQAINPDENMYFDFNTSESYNFTSNFNVTTQDGTGKQEETYYNEILQIFPHVQNYTYQGNKPQEEIFYNEILQTFPQRQNSTYQANEPKEKNEQVKNSIPVTENVPDIVPVKVENIIANNSSRNPVNEVDRNTTLYVSQILNHTGPSQVANLTNYPPRQDIPEDYHRILTPKVNTLELKNNANDRYNNQPQLPNKQRPNKATSSQNSNQGLVNGFLQKLISNVIVNHFFNNDQQNGLTQTNTKTNMYNRPTNSHLVDIPGNRLLIPQRRLPSSKGGFRERRYLNVGV